MMVVANQETVVGVEPTDSLPKRLPHLTHELGPPRCLASKVHVNGPSASAG